MMFFLFINPFPPKYSHFEGFFKTLWLDGDSELRIFNIGIICKIGVLTTYLAIVSGFLITDDAISPYVEVSSFSASRIPGRLRGVQHGLPYSPGEG